MRERILFEERCERVFVVILEVNASVAGIAGDMFVSSMLHLFENPEIELNKIVTLIESELTEISVKVNEKSYHGITGLYLDLDGNNVKVEASDLLKKYDHLCDNAQLEQIYRRWGSQAISLIIEAEKQIHGEEDVHLHELGTIDTIFDIFGSAFLLSELNIDAISISPVATGTGTVKTSHGILPVPAPATQWLLEYSKITTVSGPNGECTTPTGAAILTALIDTFDAEDEVIWSQSGYGFGTKQFTDRGNLVRVRLGYKTSEKIEIRVLETNIDDISGEFLGDAVDQLLDAGALDVSYYPIFMKKNRPGYTLRILTTETIIDDIAELTMRLTGTLGIRVMNIQRHIGQRKSKKIQTYIEELNEEVEFNVKIGFRKKIEFEDLKSLGKKYNRTPLEMEQLLQKYLEGF